MKKSGCTRLFVLLLMALLALASCSGSGGSLTGGGMGGTGWSSGIVVGSITGFGSIMVNGITLDISAANIILNDQPGSEDDLRPGQVVTVTGEIALADRSGIAMVVVFDHNAEGPVDSIDLAANMLVVLGQTVFVDALTVFANTTFATLEIGNIVELSGFVNADGVLLATRIERTQDIFTPGTEIETQGIITNLNLEAQTFALQALSVDFSTAVLTGVLGAELANGQFVEVSSRQEVIDGVLRADRLALEDLGINGEEDDEVALAGFVTSFTSPSAFEVNGQPVVTTDQTEFEGGLAEDIALNARLEVKGALANNGALVASDIEIRQDNTVRIETTVDSVSPETHTLVVFGIPAIVDALTRFDDTNAPEARLFGLANIAPGDFVQVVGTEEPPGSGIVRALLVQRKDAGDAEDEVELSAPVETVQAPAFTILGVTIHTMAETVFRDAHGNLLTAAEFFALPPGRLVSAGGVRDGDMLIAGDVELED